MLIVESPLVNLWDNHRSAIMFHEEGSLFWIDWNLVDPDSCSHWRTIFHVSDDYMADI